MLLVRGAGQIIFGVMAGWEVKDFLKSMNMSSMLTAPPASQSSTEMVVAVVSKDPNVWVQVGRIIGITLAIVETGKLLASFLVSYEVKASTSHFRRTREEAYARVEQLRLTRTESQLAKGLLDPSKRIFPSQSTSIIPSEGD